MVCFLFITPLATISGWLCLRGAVDHLHFSSRLEAAGLIALTVALFTIYLFWTLVSIGFLFNSQEYGKEQIRKLITASAVEWVQSTAYLPSVLINLSYIWKKTFLSNIIQILWKTRKTDCLWDQKFPNPKHQRWQGNNTEEFKTDAAGGNFIKDNVQKVKARCTEKASGEQPCWHRAFRSNSNKTSGPFHNSKGLEVGALHAFPIPYGTVGCPRQSTPHTQVCGNVTAFAVQIKSLPYSHPPPKCAVTCMPMHHESHLFCAKLLIWEQFLAPAHPTNSWPSRNKGNPENRCQNTCLSSCGLAIHWKLHVTVECNISYL